MKYIIAKGDGLM